MGSGWSPAEVAQKCLKFRDAGFDIPGSRNLPVGRTRLKLNHFPLGVRLGGGFVIVLLLVAVMMAVGLWSLQRAAEGTRTMMGRTLQKERLSDEWYRSVAIGATRNSAIAKISDPAMMKRFVAEAKAASARVSEVTKLITDLSTTAEEKALLSKVLEQRKAYNDVRNPMIKAKEDGRDDEATRLHDTEFLKASPVYLAAIAEFVAFQHRELDNSAAQLDAAARSSQLQLAVVGLLAMVSGALFAWLLTHSITSPMAKAAKLADAVAAGDLTGQLHAEGRDEIAGLMRSLGGMRTSLHRLVSEVRQSTSNIHTASSEVASGNQDLSERTEHTAANLQQTTASMDVLTGTVRQSAESASKASELAGSAAQVANRGGEAVQRVVATMEDIATSSRKITDIIGTIDGIAFQTNILALNAAVEAARAGEQGRGFAVVAAEVRTLAQRSAAAAKEIKGLIDASAEKVEGGSRLVQAAGATMQDIVNSVQHVAAIIGEVTASASEQSRGMEQISGSVGELDRMTQQNAALVEQSAAAAESLKGQAQRLAEVVGGFRLEAV
jgi:methyl-accepting chemotaxis protein